MTTTYSVESSSLKSLDFVQCVRTSIPDDAGETQMALARIVQKAKAEVTGVYTLIALNTDWKTKMEQTLHCPVEIVYHIGEKPLQRVQGQVSH
jgi:hypothetical protein